MAFSASADSSRAQLRYVVETTPGVTPSTPTMKNLRFTGESLNANRTTASSTEIRSDRNVTDLVTTGVTATGDINIELSYGEFDDFLESALQGTWTTNVLKNGTARKSFTIEKEFSDVSKFQVFTGCEVTQFALNLNAGEFVNGSFGIMARGATDATATAATSVTPSLTNPVYNTTYHMSNLTINGVAYTDGLKTFSFSLNNNAREQRQIGSPNLAGVGMGQALLTGSLNAYFASGTAIVNAYNNDTPVAIEFTLTAGGHSYDFLLPAVKFSSKKVVAGAINQDVQLEMGWQAILDATAGCEIKITRS